MNDAEHWIADSAYSKALGVELESVSDSAVELRLPFRESNSNPGGALHGGVAASLSLIGSQGLARSVLGAEAGPFHTAAFHINYLAAAINEGVTATATLERRGKELCFAHVAARSDEGKPIAQAAVAVRGRQGKAGVVTRRAAGDDGEVDPGPMGERVGGLGFIAGRSIEVELMKGGRSRLVMPWKKSNGDVDGCTHEGAALALFDTAGAMAAWAETGPGRFKASTPSIQAQFLAPVPALDLVAFSHVEQRDDEIFWSEVEVASAQDQRVFVRGTVVYRIVT